MTPAASGNERRGVRDAEGGRAPERRGARRNFRLVVGMEVEEKNGRRRRRRRAGGEEETVRAAEGRRGSCPVLDLKSRLLRGVNRTCVVNRGFEP